MDLKRNRFLRWEVDGPGSESCAMTVFGISGVETLCSAARKLVNW